MRSLPKQLFVYLTLAFFYCASTFSVQPLHAKMPALVPPHEDLESGFDVRKIPIELQAWYMPDFGHLHATALVPLGQSIGKSGSILTLDTRLVMHHNPSDIYGINLPTVPLVSPRPKQMYRFDELSCPYDQTCAFNKIINHKVLTQDGNDRWVSIRIRAESDTPEDLSDAEPGEFNTSSELPFFVSNNAPKKGHGYCEKTKSLDPQTATCFIGKGWYDFLGYGQARIDNIPLHPISGSHTFYVGPYQFSGNGVATRNIYVDLDKSHPVPATGKWLAVPHTAGQQIFAKMNAKTNDLYPVTIDTTELADGWHSFAVRSELLKTRKTDCDHPACAGSDNTLSGVAKVWFFVNNGGGDTPPPPPPPGDDDGGDDTADNLVTNGDFAAGKANWRFYSNNGGSFSVSGGAAKISLPSLNNTGNIQLYQRPISINSGTCYRLSLKAKSDKLSSLELALLKHGSPYTNYGLKEDVNLNTGYTTLTKEFTATHTASDARLRFVFKKNTVTGSSNTYLDDISLMECGGSSGDSAPETGGNTPPPPAPPPSNDGGNNATAGTCHKWNPGHYIQVTGRLMSDVDPAPQIKEISDQKYIQGLRIKGLWEAIEEERGQYRWDRLDSILDQLAKDDKKLILGLGSKTGHGECPSGVPNYIHREGNTVAFDPDDPNQSSAGCIAKLWKKSVMDDYIRFLKAFGDRYNDHPVLEGVTLIGESAPGDSVKDKDYSHQALTDQAIRMVKEIKPHFSQTNLFVGMNFLGPETTYLSKIADGITPFGGGANNPDTVPPFDDWLDFVPINPSTKKPHPDNQKHMPVYDLYREYNQQIPILVGNDTSQLGNPGSNPTAYFDRLIRALYDFAKDDLGGHYISWNNHFASRTKNGVKGTDWKVIPGWEERVFQFVESIKGNFNMEMPSGLKKVDDNGCSL